MITKPKQRTLLSGKETVLSPRCPQDNPPKEFDIVSREFDTVGVKHKSPKLSQCWIVAILQKYDHHVVLHHPIYGTFVPTSLSFLPTISLVLNCGMIPTSWQVFEARWWAGMYGAGTWKRHVGWSNAPTIQCLDLGTLTKKWQKHISSHGIKSARTYKNGRGKKAFHGTKQLRSTGTPSLNLVLSSVFYFSWGITYFKIRQYHVYS